MDLEDLRKTHPDWANHVGELRRENKRRREANQVFEEAFKGFGEREMRGMLHIVTTFSENPKAGAELMRELSNDVLPAPAGQEKTPATADNEETNMSDNTDEKMPAWFEAYAKQQDDRFAKLEAGRDDAVKAAEDRRIAEMEAGAKAKGYAPGTEEARRYWNLVVQANGDEEMADKQYRSMFGEPSLATETSTTEGDEAGTETTETTETGEPRFPKTGGAGTGEGGGVGDTGADELGFDPSNSSSVNAAARAFMEASATPAS